MMITSMNLNERRDEMRRMIASILGERCYLVFSSELRLSCHGSLGGFTSFGLSALVRESLPEQYVGPMPAVAVVDDHLRDSRYALGSAMLFDGIVLHELAHIVEMSITAQRCPAGDSEMLRELVQIPHTEWLEHSGPYRWAGHDCRFIRALCHIHHRMASRGHWVSLSLAFDHDAYGLSHIERYADELAGECQAKDWLPFNEVLALPMPEGFRKLWTDDVVRSVRAGNVKKGLCR